MLLDWLFWWWQGTEADPIICGHAYFVNVIDCQSSGEELVKCRATGVDLIECRSGDAEC